MGGAIRGWLAAHPDTRKGWLNGEELYRSVLTALGSGSSLGLVLEVVTGLLASVDHVFPNPIVGALATMLLTLVADLCRRLNHGPALAIKIGDDSPSDPSVTDVRPTPGS